MMSEIWKTNTIGPFCTFSVSAIDQTDCYNVKDFYDVTRLFDMNTNVMVFTTIYKSAMRKALPKYRKLL